MPTGDSVLLELINQRVDKKDLLAMQSLAQDTVMRALGGILGLNSGALTAIPYTWEEDAELLRIGNCTLYWGNTGVEGTDLVSAQPKGGVVLHDTARPAQNGNSVIDLSSFPTTGRLFFQRRDANADVDNRAYYPVPGGGEKVATTTTRSREWVAFAATDATDDLLYTAEQGWYHFANFTRFVGECNVYPLSAFGDAIHQVSGSANGTVGAQWRGNVAGAITPVPSDWSVVGMLQAVVDQLLMILDDDVNVNLGTRTITANPNETVWWLPPSSDSGRARGLRQLTEAVDDLEAATAALPDNLTRYFRAMLSRPGTLASYSLYKPGGEVAAIEETFLSMVVSTAVEDGPGRVWTFQVGAPSVTYPSGMLLTDPVYGTACSSYEILGVRAMPYHPTTSMATATATRIPELVPMQTLPITLTGLATASFKLRFRRRNDAEHTDWEPETGFFFEVIGRPVFP